MVDHSATPTPPSAPRQIRGAGEAGSTGSWCCPFVMRSTCSAAQLTGAIRDALDRRRPASLSTSQGPG